MEKVVDTFPVVLSFEEMKFNHLIKLFHYGPVVEKDFGKDNFLTEDPLEALKNKRINDVDILIGNTSEEALFGLTIFDEELLQRANRYPEFVVPRKIQAKSTPAKILEISKRIHEFYFKGKPLNVDLMKEFVNFVSHSSFLYDINRFATHLPKGGKNRRYMYRFSCFSNRNIYGSLGLKYGIRKASHLDDLMYIFHPKNIKFNPNNLDPKVEKKTKEYELIKLVCIVFTNFAKHG